MRFRSRLLLLLALPLFATNFAAAQTTPDSLVREVVGLIEQNRLSTAPAPDWERAAQVAREANPNTLLVAREVLRKLVKSAPSVFARFLSPEEFNPFLDEVTGQSHVGVGLMELLSIDEDRERGGIFVVTPVPGSPAARSLKPGDHIERIGTHNTRDFSLSQNMMFLRGDTGTTVAVAVRRGGALLQANLRRERIGLPRVFARGVRIGADSVLYVRIGQFTQGTGAAFIAALDSATRGHLTSIVLDLRNNPGGLLSEAQQVLGALLGPVRIGSMDGRSGSNGINAQGTRRTTLPLAVLINRGSASAAELVASALADSKAAVTIGERTVGKGLVNTPFALSDSSCLLVATARLVTVGGQQIARNGVTPQVLQAGASPWEGTPARAASADDAQFVRAVAELRRRK